MMIRKICLGISIILHVGLLAQTNQDYPIMKKPIIQTVWPNDSLKTFEKWEIGIQPPDSTDQAIRRYVTGFSGEQSKINPYLSWEIEVIGRFWQEEDQSDLIEIPGFYLITYETNSPKVLPKFGNKDNYTDEEYMLAGNWLKIPNPYPFRVRFAPPKSGFWKSDCLIRLPDTVLRSNQLLQFVYPSSNLGNLTVGSNKRFLERGGSTFFPLGLNAPWPETHPAHDSLLTQKLSYVYEGKIIFAPETYRRATVRPRVYEVYRDLLTKMSRNGMNYVRTIQHPIATEIEWEELGNYTKRQYMAHEMDQILETAENLDLMLHWDMAIHYTFKKGVYHITGWDWVDEDGSRSYAYKKAFQLQEPIEFFQHDSARIYYQERIRYILARWGYSTSIGSFELMSEISNIGEAIDDGNSYYDQHPEIYAAWQEKMGAYIKTFYYGKQHLLTASYSGAVHPNDWTYRKGTSFDWMSSNLYDFGTPDFNRFFIKFISNGYLNELPTNKYVYSAQSNFPTMSLNIKPMLIAECEPVHVVSSLERKRVPIEMKRHLWNQAFSGASGTLPWSAWYDTTQFHVYLPIRNWMDSIELNKEKWHPGSSKQVKVGSDETWQYFPEAANYMTSKNRLVGMTYLRNGDFTQATGCISNHTVNYLTTSTSEETWEFYLSKKYLKKKELSSKRNKLKVMGLIDGTYEVQYFLPSDLVHPIASERQKGTEFRLHFPNLGTNENDFLILFKLKRIEP